MAKYKVKFARATFKPQLLGEKIVQRSTFNGTHYANTSRKILHSNYLGFMLNIQRKILEFYAKRIKMNLNPI